MQEYAARPDLAWYEKIAIEEGQAVIGPSQFVNRLTNSVIIAGGSTIFAVVLGVLAAYAFSRFKSAGSGRFGILHLEYAYVTASGGHDPNLSHVPAIGTL